MLRLMNMGAVGRVAVLVAVLLSAACTSSSKSTGPHSAAQPVLASPSDAAKGACSGKYPAMTASEASVAGDLRLIGPAVVNRPRNFAGLPDAAPVALCLVPDGNGTFAVYSIPTTTGRVMPLWTQSSGTQFTRPG